MVDSITRLESMYEPVGWKERFVRVNLSVVCDSIRDAGHPMAIATSRRHASVVEFLQDMGIEGWFEMIVGADDVVNSKPNPEPVLKILDALDWNPEKTLVVGDAPVDIMMGKGADCQTYAVTYGNGSIE